MITLLRGSVVRRLWRALLAAVALIVLAWVASLAAEPSNGARSDSAEVENGEGERLREGSRLINAVGTFKPSADRLMFYETGSERRLTALENLAMDRVSRIVNETPDVPEFIVSGTVTEFRGSNYLLVTRATIKPREELR